MGRSADAHLFFGIDITEEYQSDLINDDEDNFIELLSKKSLEMPEEIEISYLGVDDYVEIFIALKSKALNKHAYDKIDFSEMNPTTEEIELLKSFYKSLFSEDKEPEWQLIPSYD